MWLEPDDVEAGTSNDEDILNILILNIKLINLICKRGSFERFVI